MTQTDNLKLNIWSAQDPVDVGQINSNFQAIDSAHAAAVGDLAALEARLPKLLLDVTTQSDAQQVDLDLSQVDLTEYDWIDLYPEFNVEETGSQVVNMRVNNNSTANYVDSMRDGIKRMFGNFTVGSSGDTRLMFLRFYCGNLPVFTGVRQEISGRYLNTGVVQASMAVNLPTEEIQSINIFGYDESYCIPAGSRFRVMGVKI